MTALNLEKRLLDSLRTLPWPTYMCAITAMAGLVLDLYRDYLGPESTGLCVKSLRLAEESITTSHPAPEAHQLAAEWDKYFNGPATESSDPGLDGTFCLFDALVTELHNDQARYLCTQWLTGAVLYFPPKLDIEPGQLVKIDLSPDSPADSLQAKTLERFLRIAELAEGHVSSKTSCDPKALREDSRQ